MTDTNTSGMTQQAPAKCTGCGMPLDCEVLDRGVLRVGCACFVRELDVEMPDTWLTDMSRGDSG